MNRPFLPRPALSAESCAQRAGKARRQAGAFRVTALAGAVSAALLLAAPTHAQAQGQSGGKPAEAAAAAQAKRAFVPGRILVEAKAGVSDAQFDATLAGHGGRSLGKLRGMKTRVMTVPPGQSEEKFLERLARHPHVEFAELDELLPVESITTNDPLITSQWHLPKIAANSAWQSATGAGTIIAILDTGVDASHPDLAGQLVPGWNMYDNNADTSDVYGHGTPVAGTAAAAGNNATGVASVSWGARIMPVRIAGPDGYASLSTIAQGLTWAVDNGARVANISYSASGSSTVRSAADKMRAKGGVVVVSAGNTGAATNGTQSDSLIVVSATGSTDARASWSSYGADVDLAAPGVNIYTTARGGSYANKNGTSFAAPVVAGVAALIKSLRPDFTAAQIEAALTSTALDLGTNGKDQYYGHGRVNAGAAVLAAAGAVAADTTPPKAAIAAPVGGTVSGSVTVSASASDNVGVTRVELLANGKLVGTDTSAPFSFAWDSKTVTNGSATLSVIAYDGAGNSGLSAPVAVTVSNTTTGTVTATDTKAPRVAILSPASGAKVKNNVNVSASGTDESGLEWMQIEINGVAVSSGTRESLAYKWNTSRERPGTHTVRVTARDKAGNSASTSTVVYK
jgi:subtilisin family serine protease